MMRLAQFPTSARHPQWRAMILTLLVISAQCIASAEEDPAEAGAAEKNGRILATVDGTPIFAHDVTRRLRELSARTPNQKNASPAAPRPELEKQVLEHLIDQRLVFGFLERTGEALTATEVDLELDRLKNAFERKMRSLDDYLKRRNQSLDQLRQTILWRVSWSRYLNAKLTDKLLQAYFEAHARQFDGTELRVSHILLAPVAGSPPEKTANRIRDEILSGSLTFAEAASKYSASPSGKNGGDIGLISRFEPMPEAFSQAAFSLKKNEISQPVESAFGWRLITVTEIKPGKKTWTDVRSELASVVARRLFQRAAELQRPRAEIKRTGSPTESTSVQSP